MACTTELLVPRDVVVIDEVHWLADRERGSAWTRALLTLPCQELHLVGSADILPALRAAFPDAGGAGLRTTGAADVHRRGARWRPSRPAPRSSRSRARRSWHSPGSCRASIRAGSACCTARCRRPSVGVRRSASGTASTTCCAPRTCWVTGSTCPSGPSCSPSRASGTARNAPTSSPGRWPRSRAAPGRFGMHDAGEVGTLTGHRWAEPRGTVIQDGLHPRFMTEDGLPSFRHLKTRQPGTRVRGCRRPSAAALADPAAALGDHRAGTGRGRGGRLDPGRGRPADGPSTLGAGCPDAAPAAPRGCLVVRAGADGRRRPGGADGAAGRGGRRTTRRCGTWSGSAGWVTRPAGVAEEIAGLASLLRWFTRRWPGAGGITSEDADRLESRRRRCRRAGAGERDHQQSVRPVRDVWQARHPGSTAVRLAASGGARRQALSGRRGHRADRLPRGGPAAGRSASSWDCRCACRSCPAGFG